jgi:hypothetical protein
MQAPARTGAGVTAAATGPNPPAPIAVMAFDRPQYLKQVLESLLSQRQDLRRRRMFLYLDGPVSRLTGKRYGRDEDIEACRLLFKQMIPWGKRSVSSFNLGVAANFRRAEEELFADQANRIVYFFEDDMVLHPDYLDILDNVAALTENLAPPVGYFAAFGGLLLPPGEQYEHRHELRRLDHHWGFGLRRSHWIFMQPLMAHYYRLLEGRDYQNRPTPEILSWLSAHGVRPRVSSQDDVKKAISYAMGAISLNTYAAAGKYVGELGLHMRPERYRELGYGSTAWLSKVNWRIDPPTAERLEQIISEELGRRPPATGKFDIPKLRD